MLPNCPEACADLGDVAGLPLDPSDDKYEKLSNDVIEDEVSGALFRARLKKAVHRFGEVCYCSCLPLLPRFACSIHVT